MARYKATDKYNSTLTAGWSSSPADTNLSVGSVPANVPTVVVAGRGTDLETKFSVTGTSGGNTLTGVAVISGGNVDIPQGTSVECLNNEEFINQYEDAVFDQQGVQNLLYAADGGSTDAYEITLGSDPTDLANLLGVNLVFLANTANTGAATLAVNGLTAKAIKKNKDVALVTGDIKAGQLVSVAYDGTSFQLISTGNVLTDPIVSGRYDNGNSGTTKTISFANGRKQKLTLTGAVTITWADAIEGSYISLDLDVNGTGGYAVPTLPSGKWPSGTVGAVIMTANAKNTMIVEYDGTDYKYQLAPGWA